MECDQNSLITLQNLLVLEADPNLLKNRQQLEEMAGLVENRRSLMLSRIEIHDNGCWIWSGRTNDNGYGLITLLDRNVRVHRVTWMLVNGLIERRVKVCHHCDNPPCCNPNHLFSGTQKDNMGDCARKLRHSHKLKVEEVLEIRRLRALGMKLWHIADSVQQTFSTVQRICSGTHWRHLA